MRIITLILLFPIFMKAGGGFLKRIPDDVLHVYSGLAIGAISGEVTFKYFTDKRWSVALPTAFLMALGAGIFKEEVYDRQWGLGVPSNKDKVDTAYGGALSMPVLCVRFDLYAKKHPNEYRKYDQELL